MAYEYITKYDSPNYSPGRPAGAPNVIVIHYWDDPAKKPRFQGVVNWLCRPNGTSSAHYVAEAGKVACLVAPRDRAWHAGPLGNPRGIGIECNPRMSKGDLETVAELIANLRKTYGNLPLQPHKKYMNTSCPGDYVKWLGWLSDRANQINGQGGKPSAPSSSSSASSSSGALTVDGHFGPASTTRLQALLGTTQDGIISGQPSTTKPYHVRLNSVRYGKGGSTAVQALQKRLGVTADRYLGPGTIRALQRRLGVTQDGYAGPATVTAWQRKLNAGKAF